MKTFLYLKSFDSFSYMYVTISKLSVIHEQNLNEKML